MAPEPVWTFWRGENPWSLLGFQSRMAHPVVYSVHVYVRARRDQVTYTWQAFVSRHENGSGVTNSFSFKTRTVHVSLQCRSKYEVCRTLF
jgi:hypothetical protein